MATKTPLYKKHIKNDAKIVDFAGFKMPMLFEGIVPEHKAVRESVGLFDISHMGEFEIKGPNAENFLNRLVTNDISSLDVNQAQYNCMCYRHGGIVDDLLVYKLADNHYMLVVNAANITKDFNWVRENAPEEGVELQNKSEDLALIAVQGPNAQKVLEKVTDVDLDQVKFYRGTRGEVVGEDIFFSRTGYTGEDGFELYIPGSKNPEKIWDELMKAGSEYDIQPTGLGARDSLRLEMGYCLYGNDITEKTNPFEARLGWVVKLEKVNFIGRKALIDAKTEGIERKLVPFELQERGFPRKDQGIFKDGEEVGKVTSGVFSPMLEKGIALGYIDAEYADTDTQVNIRIRKYDVPALVTSLPFWEHGSVKR